MKRVYDFLKAAEVYYLAAVEAPAQPAEPVAEAPAVEAPTQPAEPAEKEAPNATKTVTVSEETPAEQLQNAELIESESIHVAFLERLCRQFDTDELNAHVKVVYKKRREKKTSIFDIIMRRNRRD